MCEPTPLSIHDLLSGEPDVIYRIPIYQRNYAWEEAEITQLIQDILDAMADTETSHTYYLGTLVVFERGETGCTIYDVIDGQQRLTTLSLLAAFIQNTWPTGGHIDPRLDFETRESSGRALRDIFQGRPTEDPAERLAEAQLATDSAMEEQASSALRHGYRLISRILPQKLSKEHDTPHERFAEYLFNRVQIMRITVPPNTDLNQYFETMNTRGEQLEPHEVLKARLLDKLDAGDRHCLHRVWEACANMQRYLQLGFTAERDALFDEDAGVLKVNDFAGLCRVLEGAEQEAIPSEDTKSTGEETLREIISAPYVHAQTDTEEDASERFGSVINFPNFLLHVLRVLKRTDIRLDDKVLIRAFEEHLLKTDDPAAEVRAFTFTLLRCKYLLDRYVIKRSLAQGKGGWSLQRLKQDKGSSYVNTFEEADDGRGINRRISMLLAAFHVSSPAQAYKYWLNAALCHLHDAPRVDASAYLGHLESVARAFVFDRFLRPKGRKSYFEIIDGNGGACLTRKEDLPDEQLDFQLSFGQIENNLIFNYLDYLLWLKHPSAAVRDFEFTFRSSVEHYYPRTPISGKPLPKMTADSFGNLCLISASKNSRLSNFLPPQKNAHYADNTIDSVKQHLMMNTAPWDEAAIQAHAAEMKQVLLDSLDAGGGQGGGANGPRPEGTGE